MIDQAGAREHAEQRWHLALLLTPGVLLCGTIALASHHLSGLLGGPVFVYALLLGVAFHGLCIDERVSPGVELCARTLLRWGVALLGARVTWSEIAGLGWWPLAVVLAGVGTTMGFGVWLSSRLRMPRWQGVLSGGATAICGASAALALSAVLPKGDERERFTLLVVVGVTALSTVAMLVYPLLAHMLALSSPQAALFLGGSIHDVAQVVAAGLMISDETGTKAAVIKLMRVALLAIVVAGVAIAYRRGGRESTTNVPLLPWFLCLFLLFAAAKSAGFIGAAPARHVDLVSQSLLAIAIVALGVKTSLAGVLQTGWRPLLLLVAETVWVAGIALIGACAIAVAPVHAP